MFSPPFPESIALLYSIIVFEHTIRTLKDKIHILFIPFVLTLLLVVCGYTFLNWLLLVKLQVIALRDIISEFAIPMVLAGGAAMLLRLRLKMLNLRKANGSWLDFYTFILWLGLAVPTIIAQFYMVKATGQLTALKSITEISEKPSRYYTVSNVYTDKSTAGVHTGFEVSGRYNEHFDMQIFVAVPVFDLNAYAKGKEPSAWLGVKYRKQISNRLEAPEKEAAFTAFANECQASFDAEDLNRFEYLDRITPSDDLNGFTEAIRKSKTYKGKALPVLVCVNEPYETRNGNTGWWLLGVTLGVTMLWFVLITIPAIDHEELDRIKQGGEDLVAKNERAEFMSMFIPREDYFVTPIIGNINILIYVVMVCAGFGFINFKATDLLNWGANYGPLTRGGQWWRLLTCTFLHGGVMHLLGNMFGLLVAGTVLEPLLGRTRYTLVYIGTGLLASLASIWWYDATVSVGASGAIFGLYGVLVAFFITKVFPRELFASFGIGIAVFVGINLVMGLAGGIDNAAHIGGLLSGLLAGVALTPWVKRKLLKADTEVELQSATHRVELVYCLNREEARNSGLLNTDKEAVLQEEEGLEASLLIKTYYANQAPVTFALHGFSKEERLGPASADAFLCNIQLIGNTLYGSAARSFFAFDLDAQQLVWTLRVEESSIRGFTELQQDFLLFSVMTLYRVNRQGLVMWTYKGYDELAAFSLEEESIKFVDNTGNRYILNFAGELLSFVSANEEEEEEED